MTNIDDVTDTAGDLLDTAREHLTTRVWEVKDHIEDVIEAVKQKMDGQKEEGYDTTIDKTEEEI